MYIDPEKKIQGAVLRTLSLSKSISLGKRKAPKKAEDFTRHLAKVALVNCNFDMRVVEAEVKALFKPFRGEFTDWFDPSDFQSAIDLVVSFASKESKWRKECQGLAARIEELSA